MHDAQERSEGLDNARSARERTLRRMYPEIEVGGFTHLDGSIEFYSRVNSLLSPEFTVVDLGAGRGAWTDESETSYRRRLRDLRGKVQHVIGVDVDPAVQENPALDEARVIDASGRLPLDSASVDMVISDSVFEHIEDPRFFAAEIARVLSPGGWLCARTPNRWGYPALAARLIPNSLHDASLKFLQPQRKTKDVFPTYFRLNSRNQIIQWFPASIWKHTIYGISAEPAYAGTSLAAWQVAAALHRVLPPNLQTALFAFLQRRPAVSEVTNR